MNRFLLGALAMGAVFVLASFAHSSRMMEVGNYPATNPTTSAPQQQGPTAVGPTTTTVSYYNEPQTGSYGAFVWEWKGTEIVAASMYAWGVDGVQKKRVTVIEKK